MNKKQLENLIRQQLHEITYSSFKKDMQKRTSRESLHEAISGVKKKLQEIEKLIDYTSRMKSELSESNEGMTFWKNTVKSVGQINEMSSRISNKIKDLYQ